MKKTNFFLLLVLLNTFCVVAQNMEDVTLFSIDNKDVFAKEFIRVYNKNLDLVKDDSQKDVDNYLDLFINYKLKLNEAYALNLHEKPSYKREFQNYRSQLVKNFLTDHKVTDALVKEAYSRVTNEVKASHILIRLQEHDADTVQAYNKIIELRERFINEDYNTLQKELHNGNTVFVEDLGYFSGFKMVYDFETAAFNTKVGEVSQPFRTQFGYHVVKVFEKRASRGEVTVAHIMVSKQQQEKALIDPEKRINDIYKKLNNGEAFESLAKQFSDDKSSADKGGKLASFKSGQLNSVVFEDMAFSLEIDEVSKPFETQYGWHITKTISKKGNPTFNEAKPELERRVKRDSRSKLINSSLITKLKKKYNISNTIPDLSYFITVLDSSYYRRNWKAPDNVPNNNLIKIDTKNIAYQDFINHILSSQKKYKGQEPFNKLVKRLYTEFLNSSVKKYHEENLENENEEFAQIVNEYRDGLLLFDLMEDKIWNAAKNDTLALQDYYEKNKTNYKWEGRIEAVIASASNKKELLKIKKELNKGKTIDEIEKDFSTNNADIIFTKDIITKNHQLLSPNFKFKKGLSEIYKLNNAFHLVLVKNILPEGVKTLDEARGFIVTDFQEQLEKKWLLKLRNKYKISIDKSVLENVKKELQK